MALKAQPNGYYMVTPSLVVDGAGQLIEFIKTAFGASERVRMPTPDGKVAHAEVEIGDCAVMVADGSDRFPAAGSFLHVYVSDVDNVYRRALAAGATAITPVEDQFYGDRSGNVLDPWGNRWTISTHVEDVSEAEMESRMAAMAPA